MTAILENLHEKISNRFEPMSRLCKSCGVEFILGRAHLDRASHERSAVIRCLLMKGLALLAKPIEIILPGAIGLLEKLISYGLWQRAIPIK